jgi:hypothetical protein
MYPTIQSGDGIGGISDGGVSEYLEAAESL